MSDTFFDDMDIALLAENSPVFTSTPLPSSTTARKRTRTDAGLPQEVEEQLTSDLPRSTNQNLLVMARHIAESAKLTAQQSGELDVFATDTIHVQNMHIFAMILALNNRVDRLVPPPSAFALSADFMANLKSYAHGVIFSSKIALYKGTIPQNHLLDIVKRFRWGLPEGIENDTAKWKVVKKQAGTDLTAVRRKVKLQIIASMRAKKAVDHWTIYDLAAACIKGTDYKITVPLLARIALMRGVYSNPENRGDNYWDQVDVRLAQVADKAKGNAEHVTRLFKHFLDKDRKEHGAGTDLLVDENEVDNIQENIDHAIEERNRLLAANPRQAAAEADEPEEQEERGEQS
ncbi:hypothetical protein K466DRAFT_596839 [Polyporus arcularius HHB13444]|uniref:Uncharacterized protein n=1 Tax=Polyporus arcularius HHB13444 TaxID=1314778 RepID=A0A5C3PMN7_9APHY|nr:hypothetical protein K466DRAFT_596839 [Polyporus arcularius HHB13444]